MAGNIFLITYLANTDDPNKRNDEKKKKKKTFNKIFFFPISVSCDEFILTGEKKKKKIPELCETRPCVCVCVNFSVFYKTLIK